MLRWHALRHDYASLLLWCIVYVHVCPTTTLSTARLRTQYADSLSVTVPANSQVLDLGELWRHGSSTASDSDLSACCLPAFPTPIIVQQSTAAKWSSKKQDPVAGPSAGVTLRHP